MPRWQLTVLIGLAACGDASAPRMGLQPGSRPTSPYEGEGDAHQPDQVTAACSLAGNSRSCICTDGVGYETCAAGNWGPCRCTPLLDGPANGPLAGMGADASTGTPGTSGPTPGGEPRTGVVFEWPETDPSQHVPCEPGRYVGTFACDLYIVAMDGDPAFRLSGTVDMTLEQSMDGELLRIANGKFMSAAAVAIPAWGDIVGELDCRSGRFEGRLENGRFSVALGLPIPFTEGTFEGDLSANYDRDEMSLQDGLWDMVGQLDGFPGSCTGGAWSAVRAP